MSTTELVAEIRSLAEVAKVDASRAIAGADLIRPRLADLAACELRALAATLGVEAFGREPRAALAARIVRREVIDRAVFHQRARVF